MSPAQVFGIVIRTVGLIMTLYGTGTSSIGLILALGLLDSGFMLLAIGIPIMLAGVWLLRGPQLLIAFAYPEQSPQVGQ